VITPSGLFQSRRETAVDRERKWRFWLGGRLPGTYRRTGVL